MYGRTKKYRTLKSKECDDASDEGKCTDAEIPVIISSEGSTMDISSNSNRMKSARTVEDLASSILTTDSESMEIDVLTDMRENLLCGYQHFSEATSNSEPDSADLCTQSSELSDADIVLESSMSSNEQKNLQEKLRDCAVKHAAHITHGLLNELLKILRSEGHMELPKTAETLLRTERTRNKIRLMTSKKGTYGTYIYMGVENKLRSQFENSDFKDTKIRVLVNVDGLPIYAHSKQQLWPILMHIFVDGYYCKPFVVALYCGDSKPNSADDYMHDFVDECTTLIEHGLVIENIERSFEIAAFVCDTPARSFIKCCKPHTAFCGCERCESRGKTVNKRRVYRNVNCTLRTKDSFLEKRQSEHHVEDATSPLVRIPGFDPVRGVILDYMHLLCCGIMKLSLLKNGCQRKE